MGIDITDRDDGGVHVRIKSTRGTGTRDEDEVIAQAIFNDMEAAEDQSRRLNKIVKERLLDARQVQNPPEEMQQGGSFVEQGGSKTEGESDGRVTNSETASEGNDYGGSKIYLGNGARLSGWIPLPREVIFDKIAPLVANNEVEDSDPHISVNFSEDIPLNGWKNVDKETVLSEIEPTVQKHRLDSDQGHTPSTSATQRLTVKCPVESCSYVGDINQVLGHVIAQETHPEYDFSVVSCPIEGCSYEGTVDSISGHFFSKQDDEHDTEELVNLDIFEEP